VRGTIKEPRCGIDAFQIPSQWRAAYLDLGASITEIAKVPDFIGQKSDIVGGVVISATGVLPDYPRASPMLRGFRISVQREFPGAAFGMVIGLSTAIGQFTFALAPWLLGIVRDETGGYIAVLGLCMALQLGAAVLVLWNPLRIAARL
jgi:hypothetical protein